MKNYFEQFLLDNNRIVGDRFQINCETFTITLSNAVYVITSCGKPVPQLLMLNILLGVQPISWLQTRHFGVYDK